MMPETSIDSHEARGRHSDIKDDTDLSAIDQCARCGTCRSFCPVFEESGWESANARGPSSSKRCSDAASGVAPGSMGSACKATTPLAGNKRICAGPPGCMPRAAGQGRVL